jgi:hypothetical protein
MRFSGDMASLSHEQRLSFYEVLAHNLTIVIRVVWADATISDAEKVARIKRINEGLHRVTAKVRVLRLKTHEWPDNDLGEWINSLTGDAEGIRSDIVWALNSSFQVAVGEDAFERQPESP